MKRFYKIIILLLLSSCFFGKKYEHPKVADCKPQEGGQQWQRFQEIFDNNFVMGVSDYFNREVDMESASEQSFELIRVDFPWKRVEPVLDQAFNQLTVEKFKKDRDYWINLYLQGRDWSHFSKKLLWAKNHQLKVIALLGHGYRYYVPYRDGKAASPDLLGQDNYLARQLLFISAFLRYFSHDESIKMVQIENELNVARLTTLWGWRSPIGMDGFKKSKWSDVNFQTKLIGELSQAVKRENPKLLVTHNFAADVHDKIQNKVGQAGLRQSIERWREYLDVIGIDSYPNYYNANENGMEKVKKILEVTLKASCQKPVMILETNYPSGPVELGFSREKQTEYLKQIKVLSQESGLAGLLIYGAFDGRHRTPVVKKITNKDRRSILKLGKRFDRGQFFLLLSWLVFNQKYAQGELIDVLQLVESYWALESEP